MQQSRWQRRNTRHTRHSLTVRHTCFAAAIPDEITQKVINALAKHLETMKKELNEQIHGTEDKVTKKIVDIDSRRPPPPPPPKPESLLRAGSKAGSELKAGSIRGSLKK